jgi:hypothetical protein
MMAPNSKSFHKLLIAAFLIAGCRPTERPFPPHKCQAIVVLDKTSSVSYINRLPKLQQEFTRAFDRTYASATKDIQSSRLVITGNTSVFPAPNHFGKDCPNVEEGSRKSEEEYQRWLAEKRKWIFDEIKQVISLIESPCTSNTTDIFSIFSGIQQVQKSNAPWDSVNVFIFSDMVNTCSPFNMLRETNVKNAYQKGKNICQTLIDHGQISAGKTENLYLTIYTPDEMGNTALVNQFWKGFFEQWGLQETHYHFE